ncbi:hypothetical protein [Clostridium intestinale]|uniref:Uncharacterized protein n=1 Tax=Clostridium intestinale TaxID=36845 RepID=A0A7D6VVU8_9CLOT|nr:hypothetical protein [Clostridium intestinale]QLY81230.1 hypothetical protein HZF06_06485 [Clostridium intestinale]
MNYEDARKRNLMVKLFKKYLEDSKLDTLEFEKRDMASILYFKQADINSYILDFFKESSKEKFKIKDDCMEYIIILKSKYDMYIAQNEALKEEYIKLYNILKSCFDTFTIDDKTYNENIGKAIDLATKLHHIYMPIYSEQMIINRGCLPEDETSNYYNHFHAIEDMYYELIGSGKSWKSVEGDINLDKDMNFKVYTVRWGHEDNYTIRRTYEGWDVRHISMNGKTEKNGTGALENNLDHDSVCYPKEGIEYAFETLWQEADTTSMSFEELQSRIQDIADWISEVEKATHKYQPNWCLYY